LLRSLPLGTGRIHCAARIKPLHLSAISKRNDAAFGKVHIACGELGDTGIFRHGLGSSSSLRHLGLWAHTGYNLVNHFP
jgi:hypothetical protein